MEKEFKTYLLDQNLSKNTITSYLYALRQFEEKYDKLTKQNLRDYKVYLIENYKPQTVNLRIRAKLLSGKHPKRTVETPIRESSAETVS